MKFEDIDKNNPIYLYCGDMDLKRREVTGKNFIGLSLTRNNQYHILHIYIFFPFQYNFLMNLPDT